MLVFDHQRRELEGVVCEGLRYVGGVRLVEPRAKGSLKPEAAKLSAVRMAGMLEKQTPPDRATAWLHE